jgi:hypothetical protein
MDLFEKRMKGVKRNGGRAVERRGNRNVVQLQGHRAPYKLLNVSYCCCDGVRLCLCGTPAANGPIAQSPDDTWLNIEQRRNDTYRWKPKDSKKNLPQGHFVHHNSHMNCPRGEPGPPWREASD